MVAKGAQNHTLSNFAENLQRKGRHFFNRQEAQAKLGISDNAFRKASARLIKQTKLLRIRNGFYIIIPPEYQSALGLPPTHYIDALMKFCKQPYYVGVLSAAALHGAAHQSPQELQIVTNKSIPLLQPGTARIRFITKKNIEKTPTQQMKTPTGFISVSTPEATAIDLIKYSRVAGSLNNVATVLIELMEKIDSVKLLRTAKLETELSTIQRLGYLIDCFSKTGSTKELNKWLVTKNPGFVFLRPDRRSGVTKVNKRWCISVNTKVEPDL